MIKELMVGCFLLMPAPVVSENMNIKTLSEIVNSWPDDIEDISPELHSLIDHFHQKVEDDGELPGKLGTFYVVLNDKESAYIDPFDPEGDLPVEWRTKVKRFCKKYGIYMIGAGAFVAGVGVTLGAEAVWYSSWYRIMQIRKYLWPKEPWELEGERMFGAESHNVRSRSVPPNHTHGRSFTETVIQYPNNEHTRIESGIENNGKKAIIQIGSRDFIETDSDDDVLESDEDN